MWSKPKNKNMPKASANVLKISVKPYESKSGDFVKVSKETGVAISETSGQRFLHDSLQQDTIFAAHILPGEYAAKNPRDFLEQTIDQIAKNHKTCKNGTTKLHSNCCATNQKDKNFQS